MEPYESSFCEPPVSPDSDASTAGENESKRELFIYLVCWLMHCFVTGTLVVLIISSGFSLRQTAEEIDLELPVMSLWLIQLAGMMRSYWYLIVAAEVMIHLPIVVAIAYLPRRFRWVTWVWFASFVLSVFSPIVLYSLAFWGFWASVRPLLSE